MAQLKILIDNQQEKKIQTDSIRQKTKQILSDLGCDNHEISILITDDARIHELNNQYRNMDKPTNVLSFPMQEGDFSHFTPGLLGDVVISCETAEKEAVDAGITLGERMSQLLIHGILHLLGFDHETSRSDAGKMEDRARELLKKIEPNTKLNIF